MRMNLVIIIVCLTCTIILLWMNNYKSYTCIVSINPNKNLVYVTSDNFLSFGLDSSLLREMKNLPINQEKFLTLARHLSPAYLRIGGTAADCLYFIQTSNRKKKVKILKRKILYTSILGQDISNFTLTSNDFLSIYNFSLKANLKIIFNLNILIRNDDGTWNSNNAREIILFAKSHGMELLWQLGNEPNSFLHVFNTTVSAKQLAKDYCKLRSILDELGYENNILIGPEINHIGDLNHEGIIYGIDFLNNVNYCIDYFTWHQYYLNGHTAKLEDFLKPSIFNRLPNEINNVKAAITSNDHNISMWLSETSSAYGGGAPKLSNTFVAGFLWLDKLGYSAKAGIKVVIRQSLYGGYYAMVDSNLDPNPDWWVAKIYKKFVSKKVLYLNNSDNFGKIRLYAHCALKQPSLSEIPVIVMYGINLNNKSTKIYIEGPPKNSSIYSYILTSENLQSRNLFMNGKILRLRTDGSVPPFKPIVVKVNQGIELPGYSMAFLLIHGLDIQSCLKN